MIDRLPAPEGFTAYTREFTGGTIVTVANGERALDVTVPEALHDTDYTQRAIAYMTLNLTLSREARQGE